jgi:hypothetical protein
MKADIGAGRILAAKSMPPIHDDAGSHREGMIRIDHERASRAEQGMKMNGETSRFKLIVAVEQWICLVLGVVCIASGIWGIFLNASQNGLSTCLAWLGSAYVPTLRVTATGCLVMGLVLVRRGVAQS